LRRLTPRIGFVAACLLLPLTNVAAQPAPGSNAPAGEAESGNELLVRMMEMFESCASLTARVRHQARLHNDTLVGSGYYWQRGTGDQRVTRFEMQTQLVGKTASFEQVFDGEYLWTDRRFPSGRKVRRLEVARLQSRLLTRSQDSGRPGQGAYEKMLATAAVRGGISQMLADLQHRFNFDPPRATQYNGLPMLALVGHWSEEELKELWPDFMAETEKGNTPKWPAQLPHHVLVLVGQNNFFPYMIEHRRFADAFLASTVTGLRPTTEPLLRYEIFEVQFAVAMDNQLFEYKPGDVDWSDETTVVLEQLNRHRR